MNVTFRKVGGFYHVFDDDIYILNYLIIKLLIIE